jgi:hypothetical protein
MASQWWRVAERHEIEPARPALAAGDGAVLLAELPDLRPDRLLHLARKRPGADARDVGLRHADNGVDPRGADADPGRGRAGYGVRRGDEGIRAVVEVEQRALGSLEQDALARGEGLVDEERGVRDERPQPPRVALVAGGDVLEGERLVVVHALQPDVLLGEGGLDLLAQDLRVEQVLDADPDPGGLVGVGRPDPTPSGADLQLAEPLLAGAVERDVPGHDQVGVAGDAQRLD